MNAADWPDPLVSAYQVLDSITNSSITFLDIDLYLHELTPCREVVCYTEIVSMRRLGYCGVDKLFVLSNTEVI